MMTDPLLVALWIGALSACATRCLAHLDGELGLLAERLLRRYPPETRA